MAGPITISVIGDTRSLVGGLDVAGKKLGGLGDRAGRAGKAIAKGLAIGVAAAGAATVAFLGSSIKSLGRIERIGAATDNVIRSTGGIANVTRGHVDELAGTLENLTATEAESITEGANMLLTFTGIRNGVGKSNQIFDQAVGAITDMSRALDKTGGANIDTTKTAVQLGKALNDPIKGVTALSKVGVSFTEDQRAQIKTLVESGKTMGAQKIILNELKKEFGGAGKAFGGTTVGKIELAKHALGTLGESLASNLLPALGTLATQATKGLAWLDTKAPAIKAFVGGVLDDLKPALDVAGDVLADIGRILLDVAPDFLEAARAVGDYLGPALASMVPYLQDVGTAFVNDILPAAGDLARELKSSLGPVFADVGDLLLTDLLPALQDVGLYIYREVIPAALELTGTVAGYLAPILAAIVPIVRAVGAAFVNDILPAAQAAGSYFAENIAPILGNVADIVVNNLLPTLKAFALFVVTELVPVVVNIATKIGTKLRPIVDQLVATFRADVLPTVQKIIAKFEEWRPAIQKTIVVVAKIIGKVLEFAASILAKVLPPLIRFAGFMLRTIVPAVLDVIGVIGKIIGKAVAFGSAFIDTIKDLVRWVNGVKDKGKAVLDYVTGLPGKIISGLGQLGYMLASKGRELLQGFLDGIIAKAEELMDYVSSIPGRVADALKDVPGNIIGALNPLGKRGAGNRRSALVEGLLASLNRGENGLDKFLKNINAKIAKAYKKKTGDKLKPAQLAAYTKAVRDEVNALAKAAAAYAKAKAARASYIAGVKADAISFADITGVGQVGENGEQTPASIVQGLRDRLNAIVNFRRKIAALAKAGLRDDVLQQLISAGVENGTATAEAILAGGVSIIKQTNTLQGQIVTAAGDLGLTAANAVLDPLDPDKVRRAAEQAAAVITRVLKNKFGIRIKIDAGRGNGGPGKRTPIEPPQRTRIDPNATHARTRLEDRDLRITLTAEQLTAIERGRRITVDVKAYQRAGGK